jgi:hypothetical protein
MLSHNLKARLLLALLLSATPVAAQFDFNLEKRSPARLGQSLDLEIIGAPGSSFYLLIPSLTGGPTPLALIDPADSRVLSVGTDLLGAMTVGVTNGAGGANYSLPLANDPSINGFELHWQSASLLFGATLLGDLSNDVVTLTGLGNTGVIAPQGMAFTRALSASLVDANNNNSQSDVLVVGGGAGTLTAATGLASTEQWDYRRMRFTPGPNMSSARALHSAVRLNDGRVLVIGGADQNGTVLSSCEIYNPNTNSFSPTGNMGTPRILFGACKLPNGLVMVAGGTSTLQPDVIAAITGTLESAEIYNPATGSWSGLPNIAGRRLAPALTTLANGQAMLSGGVSVSMFLGIPWSAFSETQVQIFNGSSWSNGPSMLTGRAGHQYNQVTLNDGRVLMTGGVNVSNLLNAANAAPISQAEVFNGSSWQSVNMPTSRALHTATVLPDGRVAACGGAQGTLTTPISIANVDIFNPSNNTWSQAPNLTGPRASHTATLMPDGMLLLFGGQGASASLSSVETLRY